jgi:hypothetical protein
MAYMRDPQSHPYSVAKGKAERIIGSCLVPHVNSGLIIMPRTVFNLSAIESWLDSPQYSTQSHFAEQTLFAFLASVHPSRMLPSDRYTVGQMETGNTASFIHYAAHYLSETRISMRREGQRRVLQQMG